MHKLLPTVRLRRAQPDAKRHGTIERGPVVRAGAARFVDVAEIAKWTKVIKAAGIKGE